MTGRDGMKGILIRVTPTEHDLLRTILRADGYTLQVWFRQMVRRKIQQGALALAAVEDEPGENV